MPDTQVTEEVIPLVEETLTVGKRGVETGKVEVRTTVEQRTETITTELKRGTVVVDRVPINQPVETEPQPRWEGEVLIVPVVEEEVVITKRLILKEELRITPQVTIENVEQPVQLRRTVASVTRSGPRGDGT
jgi:uncharacterized protein (TIGR02271 family)